MVKAGLFLLLCVVLLCGLMIGSVKIDIFHLSEIEKDILIHVRAPRVMLSAVVGASLALSGALFQYVMKNPLADSFTTGVSASSALGAVIAIMLGLGGGIPVFALIGGLAGLAMVYKIASVQGRIQPVTMLLAGIAMNVFCSASISFMKFLSDDAVSSIVFWLMGGFQAASLRKVVILTTTLLVTFLFIKRDYLSLDIICFDDTTASSSGVNVAALRKKIFFIASLLTAFSVGYAGIIGFVGLIVPHIVRLIKYIRAEDLIPVSLLGGAVFMVFNDLIARVILGQGQELPVGIITSTVGGVFFLYLLLKRKKELFYFD
jgi:iron complex transport system permease protein